MPIDPEGIKNRLALIAKTKGCETFIRNVINEVSNQTGIPFKSDNLMTLFELFEGDAGNRFARGGSTRGGLQLEKSGKYTLYFGGSGNWDPTTPLGRVTTNTHDAQSPDTSYFTSQLRAVFTMIRN